MTINLVFLYQYGLTPLHRAVLNNNVELTRVFIMAGAKTNLPDKVMIYFILNKLYTNVYNNVNIYCLCTTH